MANISIKLSDRVYKMECDDAEKEHLQELGNYFGEKVQKLKDEVGPVGQDRLLVMAALVIADELWETRELVKKNGNPPAEEGIGLEATTVLTAKLEEAASKIRKLSARLDAESGERINAPAQ